MDNIKNFTFYGHKEGCSYCGETITSKYSFCPFTEPQIIACDREACKKSIGEKKEKCSQLHKEAESLVNRLIEIAQEQKRLGFLTIPSLSKYLESCS